MPDKAQRPAGTGRGAAGVGNGLVTSDTNTTDETARDVIPVIARDTDPVKTWRKSARVLTEYELTVWRARMAWIVKLADAGKSQYPEHDRLIASWQIEAIDAELSWRKKRQLQAPGIATGFTREFTDDLKARIPLYDLVQNMGDVLDKRGKEYRGRCPFHDSKSGTSLTVSEEFFYCFGCQLGGDHYEWLSARWELDFPEGVRTLATMAGIELPKEPTLKRSNRRVVNVTGRAARNAS
jgi:hypothetical protein